MAETLARSPSIMLQETHSSNAIRNFPGGKQARHEGVHVGFGSVSVGVTVIE